MTDGTAPSYEPPPRPPDEDGRLAALAGLQVVYTPAEERFDRLARMACRSLGVPIATVTLIDAEVQWFKARQGVLKNEDDRAVSFCAHAILHPEPLVVPVGDAVLAEVARRLREGVRAYDAVGRYGGEEFLLVLPGCDEAAAAAIAEGLRGGIAEAPIAVDGGGALAATLSIGVAAVAPAAPAVPAGPAAAADIALATPGPAGAAAQLVAAADRALYQAKAAGRNRVVRACLPD